MGNQNIHNGHRKRMREKLLSAGAESFCDHELLEMLLYACNSRSNTNDLAHKLINRFGSLKGVLTASPEALASVDGIKSAASAQIILSREIMRRVESEGNEIPEAFETRDQIYKYILNLYKYSAVEELYMLLFDATNRLIDCVLINRGDSNTVDMDLRKMAYEALKKEAAFIVLAHNHPRGRLIASSEDALLTRDVMVVMNKLGIEVVDHVLVANNKYTSIMSATC